MVRRHMNTIVGLNFKPHFCLTQADLIHLGAKFAPCMRKDEKIFREIEEQRRSERETGCCIRNDDSGCVQSSRRECSVSGVWGSVGDFI